MTAVTTLDIQTTTGGIAMGTKVLTLAGVLPVEYLSVGDRVITRSGARLLRAIDVRVLRDVVVVRIGAGALGHDRPEQDACLTTDQTVRVRDWRAQALYGRAEADVPAARLVDGEFVRLETVGELRIFVLHFDTCEVVYADGLELPCDPVRVRA